MKKTVTGRKEPLMRKYCITGIYFLLLLLLLTACGKEPEQVQEGPQEVVLVALEGTDPFQGDSLPQIIQRFNESQSEYMVRLEYIPVNSTLNSDGSVSTSGEQFAEAMERLKIDLVTGIGGYDVLWMNNATFISIDVQDLLDAGILEDLGIWLDKDGGLERDDIFNMVLTAFTVNDTLFALPAEFYVTCLSGSPELLGDRTDWTLREFLDFAAEYPDMNILNCDMSIFAVYFLFVDCKTSFVYTNENGQLVFDEKLLSDFLEFCKNVPSRQGEQGIFHASISLTSSQHYRYLDTDPITFIGYPTQDKQNGCVVENSGSVSICSNSDCKEGAWAFLEFFLLHKDDNRNTEYVFATNEYTYPAVKELFEKRMAEELYIQWDRDENGEILLDDQGNPKLRVTRTGGNFVYPPITEEDVAFVRDFLLSSRGAHLQLHTTDQLYKILAEESAPYFNDQKTLEEVVEVIKRRMMLYYQEQEA